MIKKTSPERQLEIAAMAKILSELSVGATATYVLLSVAAGVPVSANHYSLIKARHRVERQSGMRFSTVRNQGVRKLDVSALPEIGQVARNRTGRIARRQARRLRDLNYNVDQDTQRKIDAERSLLGVISTVSSARREHVQEHTSTGPVAAHRVLGILRGD